MSRRRKRGYRGPQRRPRTRPVAVEPTLHVPERPVPPVSEHDARQHALVAEAVAVEQARLEAMDRHDAHLLRVTRDEPMISEPTWFTHTNGRTQ